MAKYYPINLNLENKDCLVVGAGAVAERKIKRLLDYGAKVAVVSPKSTLGIKRLAKKHKIRLMLRHINIRDINGRFLVISATGERRINSLVSKYCKESDILVNVVDSPKECNFILPSVVKRGDLTVSISTDGVSPALAKKIRRQLKEKFGAEYASFLKLLKTLRADALKKIRTPTLRKAFFEKVVNSDILMLIKKNKIQQAKTKLKRMLENV